MDIEKKVLHETPLSEVESVNLMEKASIMFSPEKVEKAVELEVSVEVPTNKIPDFKTLQEAMADPNTIRFIEKRLKGIEADRTTFIDKMNKKLADYNRANRIVSKEGFRMKRSAYDFLVENDMFNIKSITDETILIAQKSSTRVGEVRAYIEMISHNAIADMLNWYVKGDEDAKI
jgi:hypothetical protein